MKVLSLQEPFASFIAMGHKLIETRSWKTNYRGEILIHASKSRAFIDSITDKRVLELMEGVDFKFGKIICKAKVVDCIKMDEALIERVKQSNEKEYLLGIYEVGRYAWILEGVEVLKSPIEAKGSLNLWEYSFD